MLILLRHNKSVNAQFLISYHNSWGMSHCMLFRYLNLRYRIENSIVSSYIYPASVVFGAEWSLVCSLYVGSKLLIHELSSILDGSARLKAQPQEDSQATLAPKVSSFHLLIVNGSGKSLLANTTCDITSQYDRSFSICMENGEGSQASLFIF